MAPLYMLLKEDILNCARFSTMSYLDQEKIHDKYILDRPYNKNSYEVAFNSIKEEPIFIHNFKTDCQLIVSKYKKCIMIIFRGTESKKDIFTDLNICQKRLILKNQSYFPLVHAGFLSQFSSVKDEITKDIKDCKSVIFGGHSLGGAIATIASLYFSFYYRDKTIKCVTFGSPRVGDKTFANLFDKTVSESLRFVNDNDPVPCLPTAWRYKHVKGLQWLNQDIILKEIKVWRFYRFIKNMVLDIFGYGYNALTDHSCANYINDIFNIYYDK